MKHYAAACFKRLTLCFNPPVLFNVLFFETKIITQNDTLTSQPGEVEFSGIRRSGYQRKIRERIRKWCIGCIA